MDQEKKAFPNSQISAEPSNSKISSCMSLEKISSGMKDNSQKDSLHLVMSVQGSSKSDIFQKLISSGTKQNHGNRQSFELVITHPNMDQSILHQQRKRDSINNLSEDACSHVCTCYDVCDQQTCPCYDAKDQFCQRGNCCMKCIQTKIIIMQSKRDICTCKQKCLQQYCSCFLRGQFCSNFCQCNSCLNQTDSRQRNDAVEQLKQKIARNDIFCTCKKTKCNKKYCSCYANSIKCGPRCLCQECTNCDHMPPPSTRNNGMDIEQIKSPYTEQQINKQQMPQNIEFVPFIYKF